jgi:mannitol-1-/sugar-/sorbitol-6-phosphatase
MGSDSFPNSLQEAWARFLLVDMDGTLLDSAGAIASAWGQWSQRFEVDAPSLRAALGGSSADTVDQLLPPARVAEGLAAITEAELRTAHAVRPTDGAREFVDELPRDRWALVTSSRAVVARARMRAAGLVMPPTVITADDYQFGKPNADPYITALLQTHSRPESTIAVEDSPTGVESAKGAELRCVAVLTYSARSELADADWVLRNLRSVHVTMQKDQLRLRFQNVM